MEFDVTLKDGTTETVSCTMVVSEFDQNLLGMDQLRRLGLTLRCWEEPQFLLERKPDIQCQ